jgi:hypothetical protein
MLAMIDTPLASSWGADRGSNAKSPSAFSGTGCVLLVFGYRSWLLPEAIA